MRQAAGGYDRVDSTAAIIAASRSILLKTVAALPEITGTQARGLTN
jgi:hypothetical protein